jgi:2'-5' RNA ligase
MTRDYFIKLLNEQPKQNDNIPFTKVNIHIALRGDIVKYCIKLNNQIQAITPSQVDFSPSSFQIPHLTLEMGLVKNDNDFCELMNSVADFASELKPFTVIPLSLYLAKPSRNYAFVETDKVVEILHLKSLAKDKFKKWIIPLEWDVSKAIPHITVGYISNHFDELEDLLNDFKTGPQWTADAIEVSYTGSRGSCIGTIRTFEFGHNING